VAVERQSLWLSFADPDACVIDVTSAQARAMKPHLPRRAARGAEWLAAAMQARVGMGLQPWRRSPRC
jgi:hypothetical protein